MAPLINYVHQGISSLDRDTIKNYYELKDGKKGIMLIRLQI